MSTTKTVSVLAMVVAVSMAATASAQTTGQATVQGQVYVQPAPQQQPAPQGYGQQPYVQQQYPAYAPPQPQQREPRRVERANVGLIVTGAVMLGVSWITNFIVGLPAGDDPFVSGTPVDWEAFRLSSLIPVAGPWVQLGVKPTGFSQDYWAPYLILDGLLQVSGLTLLIVGLATPRTETVYADLGGGLEVAVLPTAGPGRGGLSILGRF